jgi:hypothetical protein
MSPTLLYNNRLTISFKYDLVTNIIIHTLRCEYGEEVLNLYEIAKSTAFGYENLVELAFLNGKKCLRTMAWIKDLWVSDPS